jgi:hypothetical protein
VQAQITFVPSALDSGSDDQSAERDWHFGQKWALSSVLDGEVILPPRRAAASRITSWDQTVWIRLSGRSAEKGYAFDDDEGPHPIMMARFEPVPLRG